MSGEDKSEDQTIVDESNLRVLEEAFKYLNWREDPVRYARERLGVQHLTPGQEEFLRSLANLENRRILICAARATGKTFATAMAVTWSLDVLPLFFGKSYKVSVLGGSFHQAQILYRYCKEFFRKTEISMKLAREPLMSYTEFLDGSSISILTASEKQVRGPHVDLLIIDEAAEVPDSLIKAAFPQVASSPYGRIIMLSTPHQYFSYFVELWENAKTQGWKTFHWTTYDCFWIRPDQIEEAKQTLDEQTFKIEWEGKPVPIVSNVFTSDQIRGALVDEPFQFIETLPTFMGVDWGYEHPTVITLVQVDKDTFKVLSVESYSHFSFDFLLNRISALAGDFKVQAIYVDSSHKGENQRLKEMGLPIREISFSRDKMMMISNLRSLFERRRIKIPKCFEELIQELSWYSYALTKEGKITTTKKRDDHVDSLMLACRETPRKADIFHFATGRR